MVYYVKEVSRSIYERQNQPPEGCYNYWYMLLLDNFISVYGKACCSEICCIFFLAISKLLLHANFEISTHSNVHFPVLRPACSSAMFIWLMASMWLLISQCSSCPLRQLIRKTVLYLIVGTCGPFSELYPRSPLPLAFSCKTVDVFFTWTSSMDTSVQFCSRQK